MSKNMMVMFQPWRHLGLWVKKISTILIWCLDIPKELLEAHILFWQEGLQKTVGWAVTQRQQHHSVHASTCDCLLLPQNCLCPDRISLRCFSPHHVFKLSGLHFDKYSSGNSITVSHSKDNCSHLWSALEKKIQSSAALFELLLERTSTAVRVLLIISHKRRRTTLDDKMLFFSWSLIISHYFKSK